MADRYLKIILTVIALELLWLAVWEPSRPAFAQDSAGMPVIITGIRLDPEESGVLPVTARGTITIVPAGPVKIEADRPLLVESVPYTPSARPGE